MEFNGIQPRDAIAVSRDNQPRAQSPEGRTQGESPVVGQPVAAPEGDGVLASFEAARPGEDDVGGRKSNDDRQAEIDQATTQRDISDQLVREARPPVPTEIKINVDPETEETFFAIRDRETGEVLRQIPEQELKDALREGPTGNLVDRTF